MTCNEISIVHHEWSTMYGVNEVKKSALEKKKVKGSLVCMYKQLHFIEGKGVHNMNERSQLMINDNLGFWC